MYTLKSQAISTPIIDLDALFEEMKLMELEQGLFTEY
jgi:hypothetical protein